MTLHPPGPDQFESDTFKASIIKRIARVVLISGIVLIVWGFLVEPFLVVINRIEVADKRLSRFFKSHKTIFLSDLHITALGLREKILLSRIEKIDPDIVLLAGDYVSWNGDYDRAIDFLSHIKAKMGVFAVMGDSDYQDSRRSCRFCHQFDSAKPSPAVRFLRNERIFFPNGDGCIVLSGVELFLNDVEESRALLDTDPNCPEIVLSQRQINIDDLPRRRILMLSGDTHGGQALMPDILWKKFFKNAKGRFRKGYHTSGNRALVVTSGIGTNQFPFRFLCPPEIVLFRGSGP